MRAGAAAIRAAKISEAYNRKEEDDDEMGEAGLEQNVTIKEFPSYFKVSSNNFTQFSFNRLIEMLCVRVMVPTN